MYLLIFSDTGGVSASQADGAGSGGGQTQDKRAHSCPTSGAGVPASPVHCTLGGGGDQTGLQM